MNKKIGYTVLCLGLLGATLIVGTGFGYAYGAVSRSAFLTAGRVGTISMIASLLVLTVWLGNLAFRNRGIKSDSEWVDLEDHLAVIYRNTSLEDITKIEGPEMGCHIRTAVLLSAWDRTVTKIEDLSAALTAVEKLPGDCVRRLEEGRHRQGFLHEVLENVEEELIELGAEESLEVKRTAYRIGEAWKWK